MTIFWHVQGPEKTPYWQKKVIFWFHIEMTISNRKDYPHPIICTIYELNKPSYYKMNTLFHSWTTYDFNKKLLTKFYQIFWFISNLYVKDWSFFETTSKMKMTSKMRMSLKMKMTVKLSFLKIVDVQRLTEI